MTLFWWTHGHHREGIGWVRSALERVSDLPAELEAVGRFNLAFLWAHDADDWAGAATILDDAIAVARAVAPEPAAILGYALVLRGECANFAGDHDLAEALTREGAAIIRSRPDPWGAGFALWNVGFTHLGRGDLDEAQRCFEEMVAIQRRHGIGLVQMIGVRSLTEIAEARGDVAALADAAAERRGRIDLWFNNAGIEGGIGPLTAFDDDAVRCLLDTNVKGVYSGMRHAVRHMDGGGVIVNTASFVGVALPVPVAVAYGATRSSVDGGVGAEIGGAATPVDDVRRGHPKTRLQRLIGGHRELLTERARRLREYRFPLPPARIRWQIASV